MQALAANAEVGATKRLRAVTMAPPRERQIIKAFVGCLDRPHSARGRKVDEDEQIASVHVSRNRKLQRRHQFELGWRLDLAYRG